MPTEPTRAADTIRPPVHDAAPVINSTEARQGSRDNRVRWVLIFGIPLVVLAFVLAFVVA